jgi:PST family polysaccharide transporter
VDRLQLAPRTSGSENSGVRPLLAFGRDLTGYNVLNYFTRNLDNLLIGKLWGAQQLGIYAKAYQLLLMPLEQLGIPLDGIALTALSRLTDSL